MDAQAQEVFRDDASMKGFLNFMAQCTPPVSYTHLDVYKRQEAGVGFLNHAQTGSLKVVKTADDDQIEGRAFKITGTDFMGNAYEQEFQTDENGEINVTLRVGEYTVSEVAGEGDFCCLKKV